MRAWACKGEGRSKKAENLRAYLMYGPLLDLIEFSPPSIHKSYIFWPISIPMLLTINSTC